VSLDSPIADAASRDNVWSQFRDQMPVAAKWAFFDHAAVAPLPAPVRDAFVGYANDMAVDATAGRSPWRKRVDETRRLAAAMIAADPAEIALVRNTTEGIGLVAEGFPWQPGDNVVLPAGEFPSNLFSWLNLASRGVEARIVPTENERLDLDRLEGLCDARTRMISVSWVGFATGWRNDLAAIAEIAHRRGALLFVDAIQGLGVLPLSVAELPIDFLAADGHKWLLGPEGAGVLFVRRAHLDRLRTLGVGWNSVRNPNDYSDPQFELKSSAGRYEGGSYNIAGIAALGAALKLLTDHGVDRIGARLLTVTDRLVARLTEIGAEVASCRATVDGLDRRSGIVAATLPGVDPAVARLRCLEQGVVLNVRGGRLRMSPHAYTNEDDIERLVRALTKCRPCSPSRAEA